MEAKLEMLRRTMDVAEAQAPAKSHGGGRWQSGAANKPLRAGYVKGVLEAPRSAKRAQAQTGAVGAGGASGVLGADAHSPSDRFADEGALSTLVMPGQSRGGMSQFAATDPSGGGDRAANNLQAALHQQSTDAQDVARFLAGLSLDRYVSIFVENGFDSMDVVQEMTESHMREIGMAIGHIVKLQKRLAEMRPPRAAADAAALSGVGATGALAGATAGAVASPKVSSHRRVSFGSTNDGGQSDQVRDSQPAASGATLAEGCFDEAESAASFQEALRAWREGSNAGGATQSSTPVSKLPPGSFWSTVGGTEVDLARCSTPVKAPLETAGVDSETQRDPAPSEEKLCCYHCFKQFYKKFAVERSSPLDAFVAPRLGAGAPAGGNGRLLCSEACAENWVAAMEQKAADRQKRQERIAAMQEAQRALEEQQSIGEAAAKSEAPAER